MLTTSILTTFLFAATVTASALPAALTITKPKICKKPFCISFCGDGYPYNCCVNYVQDPCTDHQWPPKFPILKPCKGPDDFECQCRCAKYPKITYFCNANYFKDPCSPPDDKVAVSAAVTV